MVAGFRWLKSSARWRAALATLVALGALLPAAVARGATPPGSLDHSFGSGGLQSTGSGTRLFGSAVQSDGKVVAAGQTSGSDLMLVRFTSSGALDSSFGSSGIVTGPATGAPVSGSIGRAVAIQPDGKLVVVGSSGSTGGVGLLVERFNANGSHDSSFGSGGAVNLLANDFADGYSVAIQPDGKILAGGAADEFGSDGFEPRVVVVRLNANGSLDSSFGSGGVAVIDVGPVSAARGLALGPGGTIALAGSEHQALQVPEAFVARLTGSGALDHSFAGSGYYIHQFSPAANSAFYAVAVQGDGKLVAGGAAVTGTGADAVVARFTTSGALDPSFGSGGAAYTVSGVAAPPGSTEPGIRSILAAPGGDIIGAGYSQDGPFSSAMLWALTSGGSLDGRFGSGGAATTNFGSDRFNEFSGLALAPNGELAAAGDTEQAYQGTYTGIAALYGGFGAPPPVKVSLKGVGSKYKTKDVAKHGLKVGVACNELCSIQLSLVLSAKEARKLHIKTSTKKCTTHHGKRTCKTVRGYYAVTLAAGSGSLDGSGTDTLKLRLNGHYVKTLEAKKSFVATLSALVTSSLTSKPTTVTKTLKFTG